MLRCRNVSILPRRPISRAHILVRRSIHREASEGGAFLERINNAQRRAEEDAQRRAEEDTRLREGIRQIVTCRCDDTLLSIWHSMIGGSLVIIFLTTISQ